MVTLQLRYLRIYFIYLKAYPSHFISSKLAISFFCVDQVSKLKEKLKQNEKQLQKEESDRKNQLNIMKNTHDQSFNEKNRIIQLLESVLKEQETELEIARMYNPQEMHGQW